MTTPLPGNDSADEPIDYLPTNNDLDGADFGCAVCLAGFVPAGTHPILGLVYQACPHCCEYCRCCDATGLFPRRHHLHPLPDRGNGGRRPDPGVLPHLRRCHRRPPYLHGGNAMTARFDQRAYDRAAVTAAIARMNPDPDKRQAAIDAFTARAVTGGYWRLVVHTLAIAINTIHLAHAVECRRTGCRTCWAISLAVTAVSAHATVTARATVHSGGRR
jgi:hypothetical protein